jgi:hypothetical protein
VSFQSVMSISSHQHQQRIKSVHFISGCICPPFQTTRWVIFTMFGYHLKLKSIGLCSKNIHNINRKYSLEVINFSKVFSKYIYIYIYIYIHTWDIKLMYSRNKTLVLLFYPSSAFNILSLETVLFSWTFYKLNTTNSIPTNFWFSISVWIWLNVEVFHVTFLLCPVL